METEIFNIKSPNRQTHINKEQLKKDSVKMKEYLSIVLFFC